MVKFFKGLLVIAAGAIALSYTFGYNYLFNAIGKTYLKGESGATINDGDHFSSHPIIKGQPRVWQKDSAYNTKPFSKTLVKDLENSNTASILVIREGKLVHEQYWQGKTQETKTNSFSMAKAVTVMLLGKALEEKKIKGLNQRFSEFYKNYANVEFGKNLTLEELAKMEAGLNWNEDYKNPFGQNAKAYYGKSLEKAALLRGFKSEPGTAFEYQSGATQLLGFALRKSLNTTLAEYASDKIWKPLGMEESASWSTDDFGMEKTFCCIHSTSRDFAKLGQLFLDEGKVDSLQIISPKFLKQMQTPSKLSEGAYGMGLWINEEAPVKHFYFWGLYGQYIIIIPEKKMVIVRTGMYKDQPKDKKGRPKQAEFLVNEISKMF